VTATVGELLRNAPVKGRIIPSDPEARPRLDQREESSAVAKSCGITASVLLSL
jgi:hypothetical protein